MSAAREPVETISSSDDGFEAHPSNRQGDVALKDDTFYLSNLAVRVRVICNCSAIYASCCRGHTQVDGQLFNVPRKTFEESPVIRRLLHDHNNSDEKGSMGATAEDPLEIEGITSAEFAPFVEVLYQE